MNTPSRTPGICRIDQPAKHNHGFFVRLQRRGKIHSAFFTDCWHGGRKQALAAAQKRYGMLLAKWGPPKQMARRWWAEIRRRKGSSSIVGVQKQMVQRDGKVRKYWMATWSPEPYVVRRKAFSIRKYGSQKAKLLAIRARRAGVRSMQ
jgi:AP2 domain